MMTIIVFVLVLGLLVFVHELGHFVSARKLGVGVEEFGFGYPPRIFGLLVVKKKVLKPISRSETINIEIKDTKIAETSSNVGSEIVEEKIVDTIKEVGEYTVVTTRQWFWGNKVKVEDLNTNDDDVMIYSLNLLPLGGFVKIIGENGGQDNNPKSFAKQAIWKRSVVLSAGVIMNFVFAFILLSLGFLIGLPQTIDQNTPVNKISNQNVVIVEVFPQSPAEERGLKVNDVIVSIDGAKVKNTDEVFSKLSVNSELTFVIERNKQAETIKLSAKQMPNHDKPILGIAMVDTGVVKYGFFESLWQGLRATAVLSYRVLEALYLLIYNLITQFKVSADLSGPIGVAVITGQVAKMGFIYLLQFAAILSINLGIINILPFPALDGGRLFFILIEKIRKKKINEKVEGIIHNSGFALLMLLIVVITYRDLQKYGVGFFDKIKALF
jgi:regulator of sigma E protease